VLIRPFKTRAQACARLGALLGALLAPPCHADTANAPPNGWSGLASASLALNGGSTDSATALLNVDLARKLSQSKTSVLAMLNYSEALVDGRRETAAHKWLLSAQQDRNINDQWFAFAKGSIDGDRIQELNRRTKLSTGLGIHVLAEEANTFDVFAGFSYGDRRYRRPQTLHGTTSDHFQRPGGILGEESTHQLSESVTVKQRFEAYPDFSRVHAHSANFNGSLGVVLTQRLSLSVTLSSTFNQYAPPGVARTDNALFTGFSLRLGG
jgi:putative salt-induced outer membrane protein YdiY